jgi:hypothetical protein
LKENLDLLLQIKDVGVTLAGRPLFSTSTRIPTKSTSHTSLSRIRKGLKDEGATIRRAAPALEIHSQPDGHTETFSGSFLDLTITSTLQGHFVYWKSFEPSELLDYESCLVAFTLELPFQEGRQLSPIVEEGESSTELLDYSLKANHSRDRQVCIASLRNAEEDELGTQYDNEQLVDVSADEPTAVAPQDEDEEHRRIRRAKNAKRAQRRCNAQNRAREPRDLNNAIVVAVDREYRTSIGTITEVALLAQQLPSNPQIQSLQYLTQRALVQLDGQYPVSSTRNQLSRSEQHGDTVLVSRTPGGGHGSRRNDNRKRNEGHPSARGNNEQEVQQPP